MGRRARLWVQEGAFDVSFEGNGEAGEAFEQGVSW